MRWCFATPLSQRVPHFRAPQKYHRMSRFTTPYAQKTEHRMRSKRERWVGISPTHLARSTVFHGSPQSDNGGTICSRASLKETALWRTLSKRSQNAQPQNEILCSKGAWGRCPQQADGRKCECVLTLALLAGFVCGYPHALLARF